MYKMTSLQNWLWRISLVAHIFLPMIVAHHCCWRHLATHTLQHPATPCNTLWHTATLPMIAVHDCRRRHTATTGNTATPCNTHTPANACGTCQPSTTRRNTLQHPATPCNTLQHPATPCNTLQHPATPCNTLQHPATATHTHTCPWLRYMIAVDDTTTTPPTGAGRGTRCLQSCASLPEPQMHGCRFCERFSEMVDSILVWCETGAREIFDSQLTSVTFSDSTRQLALVTFCSLQHFLCDARLVRERSLKKNLLMLVTLGGRI